jgi:hypothetical protein
LIALIRGNMRTLAEREMSAYCGTASMLIRDAKGVSLGNGEVDFRAVTPAGHTWIKASIVRGLHLE